jgi:hypothetical protein
MTDFDPTDPWGSKSPWDAVGQTQTPPAQEAPVTNQPVAAIAENPDGVTLSFKGGPGYDASLLVIRAANLAELDRKMDQEAVHLKSVMEKAARAQAYSTALNSGGTQPQPAGAPPAQPSFNPSSGQVQYGSQQAPSGPPKPANVPDGWTYKEGTNKNGKPYKAWFPPRGVDASPIWV